MALAARAVADDLERDLRALGTPERAEGEKRYLKSDLDFLGVSVWGIRKVMKAFAEQHRDLPRDDVAALIEALWAKPVFERRMMAAMLLEEYVAVLEPSDLELIEQLIASRRRGRSSTS